jgi:putative transposase
MANEVQRTYKIRLKRNFVRHNKASEKKRWYAVRRRIDKYLRVARKVATYAIENRKKKLKKLTCKDVRFLGDLPTAISNQIIRKYQNDLKANAATNVNLIVPSCHTVKNPSIVHDDNKLHIKPLKLVLKWTCPVEYSNICQVVINKKYAYVTLQIQLPDPVVDYRFRSYLGTDTNMKPTLLVTSTADGRCQSFIGPRMIQKRIKYRAIRSRYQRQGRRKRIRQMGDREHRFMNTANHQITRAVIDLAQQNTLNVAIENLSGIRKQKVRDPKFRYFLNSWQFYDLRMKLEYKAADIGMKTKAVKAPYTTKRCYACRRINDCVGKQYICQFCGYTEHRDINAGRNIASLADLEEELQMSGLHLPFDKNDEEDNEEEL